MLFVVTAQADTVAVNGFGAAGWNADDVRDASGASINNGSTHAPGSGATLNETAVATQIDWKNAIGSLGNLGGVSLTGTSTASGKSTVSVVDSTSGLAAAGTALGENFRATYRWQNTDTVAAGVSFKIGVQSTAWSASQSGFTASRSGEASWDLLLVYDPTQPGNSPGNTTANGAFVTAAVDAMTSNFFLFGQAGNTYHSTVPGGAEAKTLAEWAVDPTWGALLFGDGAKITNTQFGFGSGNANASGVLDHATVSYLNSGARIDFVDAARYMGPGQAFGEAGNWGGTAPTSTQNLVVDQTATLEVSDTQNVRSLGVLAGTTGIVLNEGATLILNQAENGTLSVDAGATADVTGAGTLQAAVIEVGGTFNLATVTQLNGGASAHPVRDGGPSATSRYGLVVLNGGEVNLLSGADVTLANNTGVNGLKAMVRVGEVSGAAGPGVLNIEDGASLSIGSLHGSGSWGALHVGDWSGEGIVNQNGGTVDIFGGLMIGNEGGTGTYTITDGALNIYRPVDDNGAIILGRATNNRTSNGTFNIEGGLVTIGATGGANGNVGFVIGGISDNVSAYANGQGTVNQTGGEMRFESGVMKFGRGNGTYNLDGGVLAIGGTNAISATPNGVYAFNFGGGTLRVIGSDFSTGIDATLVAGKTSTIDTNGFGAAWSGNITGSGTLVKTGLGTLTLSGDNDMETYAYLVGGSIAQTAGVSTINYLGVGSGDGADGSYDMSAGTLNITQALQVGDWGGQGAFNQSGGTVNVTGSFNVGNQGGLGEYNLSGGALNLSGGLYNLGRNTDTKPASTGVFNLSGTGVLDVAGGNFIIGNRDATATNGHGTGVFNQTGGVFRISGTTGADNLFLSSYGNGEYNLLGGTLEIGGNRLRGNYGGGGTYAFNLGGGTIKVINTALDTSVDASLVDGERSYIDTNGLGATWSGDIDGAGGGLTKLGAGTLTFAGNATRAIGSFFVEAGTTAQTNGTSTFAELVVGTGAGNTGAFTMDGGTVIQAGQPPFSSPGAAASFRVGDFGGTGVFTQNGGLVQVGSESDLAALNIGNQGGAGVYSLSGGTLELAGGINVIGRSHGSNPASEGTLNINGSGALLEIKNGSSLIIGNNANRPEHGTGTVNHSAGTVRVSNGTLYVAGFGDGTYNLTGGTLEVGGESLRARYNNGSSSSVFNFGGGTIKVINADLDTDVRAVLVNGTTSTIDTNGRNAIFSQGFAGTGGFAKTGVDALTLNGMTDLESASTVSGILKIGAGAGQTGTLNLADALTVTITSGVGRLQVGVDGGNGTANFTDGASFTIDDSAVTSGWGTLDVGRGAGSIGVLNQSAGIVDVSGGALQIGYSGATGTYALSGDGVLTLGETSSIFIGSGTGANALLTIADDAVFTSDSQVFVGAGTGATGTITQTGGSATFTGPIVAFGTNSDETVNAPGTGIYNLVAGTLNFDGIIQGVRIGDHASMGSGEFNQSGGTVTFTSTALTVGARGSYNQSGGLLEIGGTNLKGSGAYNLGGGTIKVVGSALTTGINTTLTATKTLTIDTNSLGATFSGSFTGAGGVTKTGAGVLRFTGDSDYTGATTITTGTFRVDGGLSQTTITVNSGATLAGFGTVAHVNILDGGRVELGDDTGLLTATGDFSLGDLSHVFLKIAGLTNHDSFDIGGNFHAGGTLELVFLDAFSPLSGASFLLFDAGSYSGAFNSVILPQLSDGLEWNTDALASAGILSVATSAIPEPATWGGLAGLAALVLALGKRRRVNRG